ncbi:MAG: hypothetical protein IJ189_00985 [Clostridia bacterium]|nr:hypothetical protein [Clostridia bacterium]
MIRRRIFLLAAVGLVALVLLSTMPRAEAPVEDSRLSAENTQAPEPIEASETGDKVKAGCAITQTMMFSRCGHSVTRRIEAPSSVVGGDFETTQNYYDLWQIDSFSAAAIDMSREIDLFCPMHRVLGCNEAGEIVLSRNVYGDGMAIEQTYGGLSLEDFDEETQEALRLGLGFDTADDARAWLSAH